MEAQATKILRHAGVVIAAPECMKKLLFPLLSKNRDHYARRTFPPRCSSDWNVEIKTSAQICFLRG